MHEARFWKKGEGQAVRCGLCRFQCTIPVGRQGRCGVRENRDGTLYTTVYGRSISEQVDPIEKKPLYHVNPGSLSFSIATVGCNFRCLHCQNHQISQWPLSGRPPAGEILSPAEIVRRARQAGCDSIAYTYTEPTIYFEYAHDTAVLARRAGLRNLFISNGYIMPEPLAALAPYLDAANIDLKAFRDDVYRKLTGASLDGVLETLKDYRRHGIWVEVTTLVIPGRNDDDDQLRGIARFIACELGCEVPWHVTAFYPTYKLLDAPPTPADTLRRARDFGREAGLLHVYTGNVHDPEGGHTFCSGCGERLIERRGFHVVAMRLEGGCCRQCGTRLAGLFT
ncbi:AmmeMemoRadiSam system radical SAM enzyme [Geothermobacter hydrogeniphilus]|uniref:AmmeMemoRadiSam system radical SAM enzyme n=1 Tax=Geothermobacter hydrogeniphilus TaxID=1969733 RepID=A0A1X0YD02_9BACT|nr:AmmeMemoRadiSam system radical SAM enzyme [Geothermobacter hydrogeniphilus]ORJ62982.1 AmmeMemoRadiSam system radical SAM enzyme [Geothermobacter hydrogeniphilus]